MDIKSIRKIYFIGIGGIGMSALARYFRFHGAEVNGYDRTDTPLTRELEKEGIAVHYEEDIDKAPKDAELIVYTPAVPPEHSELQYYRQHGYMILKRSDVLGAITNSSFNICVAGTHGKTTTTAMIAHILRHSGYGCNAFLGGIAVNYNSNFWSDRRAVCVVEADEYDRSFLRLNPDIAVITAMDADHLDIYGTVEEVQQAFVDFSARVKPDGMLLVRQGLSRGADLHAHRRLTYDLRPDADAYPENIHMDSGSYQFDIRVNDWILPGLVLHMGGLHNVENVTAAIAIARALGIEGDRIRDAVAEFRGVKRRFEYIIKRPELVLIDDYAHHPEELRALIGGAKGLFPGWKCTVLFQPHLFTRTRDFAEGFAASLDLADQVFLLPVYPARERPIEGVTSELVAGKMQKGKARVGSKEQLLDYVRDRRKVKEGLELWITAGAGDIDALVGPVKEVLEGN
ncbi:MAG: UDP-N-acetylmuramate--L-alanine ligase [Bacteroidota bacterium]|nr:UDP-N-acetylmuramate--L-alanine ligase [Bacteroidota bacterium]MDP4216070.1 UDP-N-acetylmuramate--L-alanine ligase [Bacteroidota bacterium]MDP4245657.1 UDP-N-acetylmuramate--L-alanine ligase [Bacteroidota bacterium]MDP4252457.1 UDP-N-acetylmuramate--L-alanine ligase [Bacteroidota bacterium]MDP4256641.1 UDP-N-acetylmuramate--L-alanine ligase [Bacteroidota bacterium]